jgi:hypothetical protein
MCFLRTSTLLKNLVLNLLYSENHKNILFMRYLVPSSTCMNWWMFEYEKYCREYLVLATINQRIVTKPIDNSSFFRKLSSLCCWFSYFYISILEHCGRLSEMILFNDQCCCDLSFDLFIILFKTVRNILLPNKYRSRYDVRWDLCKSILNK